MCAPSKYGIPASVMQLGTKYANAEALAICAVEFNPGPYFYPGFLEVTTQARTRFTST